MAKEMVEEGTAMVVMEEEEGEGAVITPGSPPSPPPCLPIREVL